MRVLVLNCGSTSLRYRMVRDGQPTDGGRIGCAGPGAHARAVRQVLDDMVGPPDAVGHRITHGGPGLRQPVRADEGVVEELREAAPFAPLHVPVQVEALLAVGDALPGVPQVACFDTGFHDTLPEAAWRLPIPDRFTARGMRRYGFHGLAVESVVDALGPAPPPRLVVAHLGGGCSVTAVRDGRSVATSMGLTPEGGVMMTTRPGDLDPGVVVEMARADPDRIDEVLARECGLAAVSGGASDMRVLLERRGDDPRAALAFEMFTLSARSGVAAMASALGGLDALAFSGGIGENAAPVRAGICEGLGFMGVRIDRAANDAGYGDIGHPDSPVAVRVVPADEERVIAVHVQEVLGAHGDGGATAGAVRRGSAGHVGNMPAN